MPDNYEQSVGKLQNYISDDQICMILSSSDSNTANKMILDCLIERMSCREELLDLCDQLESISTSHQLSMLISEIRSGEKCCKNELCIISIYVEGNFGGFGDLQTKCNLASKLFNLSLAFIGISDTTRN